MGPTEFFERFNVLYNNIMSNAAPGLDAYEVSEYLTKAQLEIVKSHFSKRGNKYLEGIDDSTKRQKDFEKLIKIAIISIAASQQPYDSRGIVFTAPNDVLFVLNEKFHLVLKDNTIFDKTVVPLSYDEYDRLMSKPFGGPLRKQAWRLTSQGSNGTYYEIIFNEKRSDVAQTTNYKIRYVKRPQPIIVDDLSSLGDNLTIDGKSTVTECELDESLHEEILQRAVELAKASYATDQSGQAQLQNQINVGQRSE